MNSLSTKMTHHHLKTKALAYCGLFVALIAIGAFIKIPVPVVPFTLQYLFTMLAGLLLGRYYGTMAVIGYIAIGLLGFPIFAEGGGIWYILKPSFGYLIGFALGTYVTGFLAAKNTAKTLSGYLIANFSGLMLVYGVGMVYYYIICNFVLDTPIALWPLFLYCFILAVPGDICLCILASIIAKRLLPVISLER
ncbi:MAG: biotin transporter BioY [Anaerovibrio sp.]